MHIEKTCDEICCYTLRNADIQFEACRSSKSFFCA